MTCSGKPCELDCEGQSCDVKCQTADCSLNCDDGSSCRLECHKGEDTCSILGCPEPVTQLSCSGFTVKLCNRPGAGC